MAEERATKNVLQQRLKIRHLVLLAAIEEHGTISKAAASLNITQSATTKTLRELENLLGITLFNRSSRGVTPTVYGQTLISHAEVILSEVHSASDEIAALRSGSAGRIVVGIFRAAAAALLPNALIEAQAQYPGMAITVVAGANDVLMPALRAGEIDMLVGYMTDTRPRQDLVQERLYVDSATIVARPQHPVHTARKALSLKALADGQWILPTEESVLRRYANACFRAAGVEPPSAAIETHSTTVVQSLLVRSDMLAVLPHEIAVQLESFGSLKIVPVQMQGPGLPVGITTVSKRPLKPAARRLAEILRRVASNKPTPPDARKRPKVRRRGI